MRTTVAVRLLLCSFILLVFSHGAAAQIGIGVSVNFGPPAIPIYEQPICPADGYLWAPGYWAYDDDVATTGYRGRGLSLRRLASSGPLVIGAGAAMRSFSMKDIGGRRWASMAASITASASAALAMRAVAGKVVTSPTTPT